MTEYTKRVTQITVAPKDEHIIAEEATVITLADDGGGEYVIVEQDNGAAAGKIAITPEDWPALRSAINRMIKKFRE